MIALTATCLHARELPGDEVGVPSEGGGTGLPLDEVELGPELSLGLGYSFFTSTDERETYVGIPTLNATVSMAIAEQSRAFFTAGLGRVKGDPFYGLDGDFGDNESTLTAVPLLFGLRFDGAKNARARFNLSMAVAMVYIKEENPQLAGSAATPAESGWIGGYVLRMGPEIPLGREGNSWLGLELGWNEIHGELNSNWYEINLSGPSCQLYYVMGL